MPRHCVSALRRKVDRALAEVAGPGHSTTGPRIEALLVDYFSTNRRMGLLDRVHSRVCRRRRLAQRRAGAVNALQSVHEPLRVVQLVLDMGGTKTGYRDLVRFCSAFDNFY